MLCLYFFSSIKSNFKMLYDYTDGIDYLRDRLNFEPDFYFDYTGTPYESEYKRLFTFFNTYLYLSEIEIPLTYLFFFNKKELNAFAGKDKSSGISYIRISRGLVDRLYFRFRYLELSEFPEFQSYLYLEKKFSISISEMMYDSCVCFVFYHELGHILQQSNNRAFSFQEKVSNEVQNPFFRHVTEIDADIFGATLLFGHLEGMVIENIDTISERDAMNFSCIVLSSIFIVFSILNENDDGFYLCEKSHPHPIIRLNSVLSIIVSLISEKTDDRIFDIIKLNENEVFKETLKLTQMLSHRVLELNLQDYIKMTEDNFENIQSYGVKLLFATEKIPNSAYSKLVDLYNKNKAS